MKLKVNMVTQWTFEKFIAESRFYYVFYHYQTRLKFFLIGKGQPVSQAENVIWLWQTFVGLNSMLQGKWQHVSEMYTKVSAFKWNYHNSIHRFWITLSTFQTARKYFNNERQTEVGMPDTLNSSSSCLQTDVWTLIRIEDCSEYLVTLLRHHMKTMNKIYSSN
jgi:hypothetical protein